MYRQSIFIGTILSPKVTGVFPFWNRVIAILQSIDVRAVSSLRIRLKSRLSHKSAFTPIFTDNAKDFKGM
jgi:hypothetical protein